MPFYLTHQQVKSIQESVSLHICFSRCLSQFSQPPSGCLILAVSHVPCFSPLLLHLSFPFSSPRRVLLGKNPKYIGSGSSIIVYQVPVRTVSSKRLLDAWKGIWRLSSLHHSHHCEHPALVLCQCFLCIQIQKIKVNLREAVNKKTVFFRSG